MQSCEDASCPRGSNAVSPIKFVQAKPASHHADLSLMNGCHTESMSPSSGSGLASAFVSPENPFVGLAATTASSSHTAIKHAPAQHSGTLIGSNCSLSAPVSTGAPQHPHRLAGSSMPAQRKSLSRGLSLSIPPGAEAYGGLTPVSARRTQISPVSAIEPPTSMLLPVHPSDIVSGSGSMTSIAIDEPGHGFHIPLKSFASRKSASNLTLADSKPTLTSLNYSQSVPSSPLVASRESAPTPLHPVEGLPNVFPPTYVRDISPVQEREKQRLRQTLTGKPRRRPSMPFGHGACAESFRLVPPEPARSDYVRPPEVWRDPSHDILSGKGSTLQHARSVYAAGPIEVLPGLFLGDEHNARDDKMLAKANITTILDVAKETTLPFQVEQNVKTLRKSRLNSLVVTSESSSAGPLRQIPVMSYSTAKDDFIPVEFESTLPGMGVSTESPGSAEEQYFPPISESPPSLVPPSSSSGLLRGTLSTPNLRAHFQSDVGESMLMPGHALQFQTEQNMRLLSNAGSDTLQGSRQSRSSQSKSTVFTSLDDAQSSKDDAANPHQGAYLALADEDSFAFYSAVELPKEAIRLTVPPSPESGRLQSIRYIKLPWTHDQTELALLNGGFAQGCAVIAEALAIDHYGQRLTDEEGSSLQPGNILVHCQCGVSRSATLAIAFVMQAAALNYPYEATKNLTGMHDCYNLVKELSSSISPNVSLIYQLVEWERHLSAEAVRLREALQRQTAKTLGSGIDVSSIPASVGWSSEVMDEEEWTRMRLEEERKEQEEQEAERRARSQEVLRREKQINESFATLPGAASGLTPQKLRRQSDAATTLTPSSPLIVDGSGGSGASAGAGGLLARRRKHTRSLKLDSQASSIQSHQDRGNQLPASFDDSELGGTTPFSVRTAFNLAAVSECAPSVANGIGRTDLPLRSAGLSGSFPEAVRNGRDGRDSQDVLSRKLPNMSLTAEETIAEEDEPPPSANRASASHVTGAQKARASTAGMSDSVVALSSSPSRPPLASLLPLPGSSLGQSYISSIAKEDVDLGDEICTPISQAARSRSFQLVTSPSASAGVVGATRHSHSSSGHTSNAMSPPTLNLSVLMNDPPKADFGHFALDAKTGTTSQHRKQQHRRTFSSEPVIWDSLKSSLTSPVSAFAADLGRSVEGSSDAPRNQ